MNAIFFNSKRHELNVIPVTLCNFTYKQLPSSYHVFGLDNKVKKLLVLKLAKLLLKFIPLQIKYLIIVLQSYFTYQITYFQKFSPRNIFSKKFSFDHFCLLEVKNLPEKSLSNSFDNILTALKSPYECGKDLAIHILAWWFVMI